MCFTFYFSEENYYEYRDYNGYDYYNGVYDYNGEHEEGSADPYATEGPYDPYKVEDPYDPYVTEAPPEQPEASPGPPHQPYDPEQPYDPYASSRDREPHTAEHPYDPYRSSRDNYPYATEEPYDSYDSGRDSLITATPSRDPYDYDRKGSPSYWPEAEEPHEINTTPAPFTVSHEDRSRDRHSTIEREYGRWPYTGREGRFKINFIFLLTYRNGAFERKSPRGFSNANPAFYLVFSRLGYD